MGNYLLYFHLLFIHCCIHSPFQTGKKLLLLFYCDKIHKFSSCGHCPLLKGEIALVWSNILSQAKMKHHAPCQTKGLCKASDESRSPGSTQLITESLRGCRREKECLVKDRFVSSRTAEVSQHGCTHYREHSLQLWVSIPPLFCQLHSFLSFPGSFQEVLPHQAPSKEPEERWGGDVLATTWAAKCEAQLETPHSTCEIMLFVYCRWSLQEGSFQPEKCIYIHNTYVFHCHKLFEPLLGIILCPGLGMEAARTTTALDPAITVSGMEWLPQVPGILKIIYLYCYFI